MKLREALELSATGMAYAQWGDGAYVATLGAHGKIFIGAGDPTWCNTKHLLPMDAYVDELVTRFEAGGWKPIRPFDPLSALANAAPNDA